MYRQKSSLGLVRGIILMLSAIAVGVICAYLSDKQTEKNKKDEPHQDVAILNWNSDDPDSSYNELVELLLKKTSRIAVSGVRKLEWKDVCKYNFWVDNFYIWESQNSGLTVYEFVYKDDAADSRNMKRRVDEEVDDIISCIPEDADDWQVLLTVHDELIKRITYDETAEAPHTFDIYGALVNHRAVCQGYAYAMSYIACQLGLDSSEVYSDTHVWSKLPGIKSTEQYIDVTWDDPDEYDEFGQPYILHDCFCLKKDEMEGLEEHKTSDDEKDRQSGSGTGDNYFRRMGYYIPSGEKSRLEAIVTQQYESSSNMIEVRFEAAGDFTDAEYDILDVIEDLGYEGHYFIWENDSQQSISIGLYASQPEESEEAEAV